MRLQFRLTSDAVREPFSGGGNGGVGRKYHYCCMDGVASTLVRDAGLEVAGCLPTTAPLMHGEVGAPQNLKETG